MFGSSTLLASLRESWNEMLTVVPDLLLALALLVAGWLVARFLRKLSVRVLRLLKVDEFAERSGFEDFLVRGGVEMTAVTLVSSAVYWLVLLGVFLALLDALGLQTARVLLERIASSSPT